jgi:hypothetical protein
VPLSRSVTCVSSWSRKHILTIVSVGIRPLMFPLLARCLLFRQEQSSLCGLIPSYDAVTLVESVSRNQTSSCSSDYRAHGVAQSCRSHGDAGPDHPPLLIEIPWFSTPMSSNYHSPIRPETWRSSAATCTLGRTAAGRRSEDRNAARVRELDSSSLRFTTSSAASWKNGRRRLLSPHTLLAKGESIWTSRM